MSLVRKCQKLINYQFWNRSNRSYKSSCEQKILSYTNHIKMSNKWSEAEEIRIPVAYGFIAAKAWGNKKAEPVLALHGWQDNAGTFDKLIPLLSTDLYVVAIDGPGHGLSSHKPKGTFYHYMEILVDIQRVVEYFKWDIFSIIAHSMGGAVGLHYSSVFPERVKHLVLLDIIKPGSRPIDQLPEITREGIHSLLDIERKTLMPAPVYSIEEAKSRLIIGMHNQITEESAEVLLIRGSKASDCGRGVIFSRDIRVKMTEDLQKLSHESLKAYLCKIRCNLLIILGNTSPIYQSRNPEVIEDFIKLYEENCRTFQIVKVNGNHFVHLNNPELVAPHIDALFKIQHTKSKI